MSTLRVLSALLLLTGASANLAAQENTGRIRFGVLAGMSLAELTDMKFADFVPDGVTSERRTGAQAALYMMVPMGGRVTLQPEFHYVQKGASFTILNGGDELPEGAELKLKLGYLEVPLLLRLDLAGPGRAIQPFLVGGPSAAYRNNCDVAISSDEFTLSTKCGESMDNPGEEEDPLKTLDYGAVVGGGVAVRFLGVPASIQVRYSRGLSTLVRDADAESGNPKNAVISFLVGVGF